MVRARTRPWLLLGAGIILAVAMSLIVITLTGLPRLLELRALQLLMRDEAIRAILHSGGELVDLRLKDTLQGRGTPLSHQGRSFELPHSSTGWMITRSEAGIIELESERLRVALIAPSDDLSVPASLSPDCAQHIEAAVLSPPTRDYLASLNTAQLRHYRMVASGRAVIAYMEHGATAVHTDHATSIVWHGYPGEDQTIVISFCSRTSMTGGMRISGGSLTDRLAAARMVAVTIRFE